MNARFIETIDALRDPVLSFMNRLDECSLDVKSVGESLTLVQEGMQSQYYDTVYRDEEDTVIGIMRGLKNAESLILISKLDCASLEKEIANFAYPVSHTDEKLTRYTAGIAANLLVGGVIKRSIVPLKGDLIHCVVPQVDGYSDGIKHLIPSLCARYGTRIKGIILIEPTGADIFLGNKGHFEYEIRVKGSPVQTQMRQWGFDMFGTMFPLVNELEKVSHRLPSNSALGSSRLRIKDVHYTGGSLYDDAKEFHIVVDRKFVPEEDEEGILSKALNIANTIYHNENGNDFEVTTALATRKARTRAGVEYIAKKEIKPWVMEAHHPFVLQAISALRDMRIDVKTGYWKEISTYGGYTNTELQIPTIGIGPGSEQAVMQQDTIGMDAIEQAALRTCHIIRRVIGMPTFGWSEDEI